MHDGKHFFWLHHSLLWLRSVQDHNKSTKCRKQNDFIKQTSLPSINTSCCLGKAASSIKQPHTLHILSSTGFRREEGTKFWGQALTNWRTASSLQLSEFWLVLSRINLIFLCTLLWLEHYIVRSLLSISMDGMLCLHSMQEIILLTVY